MKTVRLKKPGRLPSNFNTKHKNNGLKVSKDPNSLLSRVESYYNQSNAQGREHFWVKEGKKGKSQWRPVWKESKPLHYGVPRMEKWVEPATVLSTFDMCNSSVKSKEHPVSPQTWWISAIYPSDIATSYFKLECQIGSWFLQVPFVKSTVQLCVLDP